MTTRLASLCSATLLAACTFSLPLQTAHAQTEMRVVVREAPPPMPVEVLPAPRHGQVWTPGYWRWNGHRYVWRHGHWEHLRHGYVYRPSVWYEERAGWRYEPGSWVTQPPGHGRGDRDHDGIPNRVDRDRDGDGVPNRYDHHPDNPRRD